MQNTKGVHVSDSIFSLVWEQIAPDYLDRYQPANCRPAGDVERDLATTQPLEAIES